MLHFRAWLHSPTLPQCPFSLTLSLSLSHSRLFAAVSLIWSDCLLAWTIHPSCWGTRSQDNPHTHHPSSPILSLAIGTAVSGRKPALVFTVYSFFLSSFYSFFYTSFLISLSCYSFAALLLSLNFSALTKTTTHFTPPETYRVTANSQTPNSMPHNRGPSINAGEWIPLSNDVHSSLI